MKTIILLPLFLLNGCDNNKQDDYNPQLPPITTTGANTAGCIINGKVLIPKNGSQAFGGLALYGLNFNAGNNFWPTKNDYWQLEIANKKDSNVYI
jgi:hypothetical protein